MRIVILILLCMPVFAFAQESVVSVPENGAVVLPLEAVSVPKEYFGKLSDFPHTYEFVVDAETPFKAEVFVHDSPNQVNDASLIVIKEERRGVSEVGRTQGKNASWEVFDDHVLVESFRSGGSIESLLQPGVYRLEVSSPNNDAVYRLKLGTEDPSYGYFKAVGVLFEVKSVVGSSYFSAIASPLIYWPLLLILVGLGIYTYMYMRKLKKH